MRAAVIPTHTRPRDFADCVAAIRPQVDMIVAVAHGQFALRYAQPRVDVVVPYRQRVPNISEMWRLGLDAASEHRWVAFLNDDAMVSGNWFDTLQGHAEQAGNAGASGWRGEGRSRKIAGYAFILDAHSGVRPDERFRWWYSDDAIQRQCENRGGFSLVLDAKVEHRYPNASTRGELRRISRDDEPRFRQAYP